MFKTSKALYAEINEFRDQGKSYGWIANYLLPGIHKDAAKSIIYRFYTTHQEIKDNKIRQMLGMERWLEVPESYVADRYLKSEPAKHPKRKRTPGGWVNAKDPKKAAKQIASHAPNRDYLLGVVSELMDIVIYGSFETSLLDYSWWDIPAKKKGG